ncbi:MAG: hypothetical protein LWW87_07255 [Geobacteraceae bacterium]|nr:hypothetical protein [Geobacteraceae bacterium]
MKLVFIKYNAYASKDCYPEKVKKGGCSATFSHVANSIKANPGLFPSHYRGFNCHWDSSCRPDPDFHDLHPSTGLCRNQYPRGTKSRGVQDYLARLQNQPHIVFYFYEDVNKNIIITSAFKVCQSFLGLHNGGQGHVGAHAFYNSSNISLPLNIVANSFGPPPNHTNCINTLSGSTSTNYSPVAIGQCQECKNYYNGKQVLTFIKYSWYLPNHTNASTLNSIPSKRFAKALMKSSAKLTSGKTNFNYFEQKLRKNGTYGRKKFRQLVGYGIEVDLGNNHQLIGMYNTLNNQTNVLNHILTQLAAGQKI